MASLVLALAAAILAFLEYGLAAAIAAALSFGFGLADLLRTLGTVNVPSAMVEAVGPLEVDKVEQ